MMEDYQGEGGRELSSLREFFNFFNREKNKMEAPPEAAFGKFAFAPTRNDVPNPKEPNTPDEAQVAKALDDYLMSNNKGPLSQKAQMLLQLKQQGYYKNILDPSQYKMAYRILETTPETLAQLLRIHPAQIAVEGMTGAGTLVPHDGQVSGWTVDPKALIRELPHYGQGHVFSVFAAKIEKNAFFGNPGKLSNAVGQFEMDVEMETIAYGPVNYDKCSYVAIDKAIHRTPASQVYLMRQALNKVLTP